MSLNILPYMFTRFAALPVKSLNALIIPEIEDQINTWQMTVKHHKNCTEKLCNELYTLIQQSSDDQERKRILNLKRSVYNGRPKRRCTGRKNRS